MLEGTLGCAQLSRSVCWGGGAVGNLRLVRAKRLGGEALKHRGGLKAQTSKGCREISVDTSGISERSRKVGYFFTRSRYTCICLQPACVEEEGVHACAQWITGKDAQLNQAVGTRQGRRD